MQDENKMKEAVKAAKRQIKKETKPLSKTEVCIVHGYHKAAYVYGGTKNFELKHGPELEGGIRALHATMTGGIPALHACTFPSCDKVEKKGEKKFSFCVKCVTKYCSKECQRKDHKDGEHRARCANYQKWVAFYASCGTCKFSETCEFSYLHFAWFVCVYQDQFFREDFAECMFCIFRNQPDRPVAKYGDY